MAKKPGRKLNQVEMVIMRAMRRVHKKHFVIPLNKVDRFNDDVKKRMMLSLLLARGVNDGFRIARWVYDVPGNAIEELQKSYKEILRLEQELEMVVPGKRAAGFRNSMNAILDEYWALIRLAINLSGYHTIAVAGEEFGRSLDQDLFPLLRKHGVIKKTPEVRFLMKIRRDLPVEEFKRAFGSAVMKEARRGKRKSRVNRRDFIHKIGKFDPE